MAERDAPDARIDPADPCPCGAGPSYERCCARLHRGERPAATAEQLMRSRFSAFVVRDDAYLLDSWHPSTRPRRVRFAPGQRWTRLAVLDTVRGDLLDQEGIVEFVASYEAGGVPGELHERSTFRRDDGRWRYEGSVPTER